MLHARLHCARTHGLYLGTFQKAIRCFWNRGGLHTKSSVTQSV